nr:hypothetical protein CFP56_73725 [Quercus suber]
MKIINLQLIIVYHIRLEKHPRSSSRWRQWSCPYHPHTSSHSTCSCPLLHSPHTSLPSHILQTSFYSVKSNAESNACLLQQQASKQDDSIQLQGKQQVGASDHVLRHQGASCATPQKRETLQLDTGHDASEGQRKNRDPILRNEDLEDLIESIPHHDQIIHSIQEMYPRAALGDASHVASVSSSCTSAGVEGMSNMTYDMVGISAQANSHFNADLMSGPCSLEHNWFG